MSILVDVPERKHFEDFGERGAFNRWMKYAIIFAVLFCVAALLMVFLMDSKRAPAEKDAQKEKVIEKLPVVADLPGKSKTSSTTKSTKSGSTTTKKPPVRKTTKTN